MSSARESILAKLAAATAALPARAPLPDFDPAIVHAQPRLGPGTLWEVFARNLTAVNGQPMTSATELASFLSQHGHHHGYCDPALAAELGPPLAAAGVQVSTTFERARYDTYQFGITRASGAIAESGSIIIDDLNTSDRLAALAAWVHVAVVRHNQILRTIPDAIEAFGTSPNIIWVTGPSKTADVEGILIEGVHGPGVQIALLL